MYHDVFAATKLPYAETCFLSPPPGAYIAFGTQISAYGSDDGNEIRHITVTAELIEPADCPNMQAHTLLQEALDAQGVDWRKEDRTYFSDIRAFITTYTFDYNERRY